MLQIYKMNIPLKALLVRNYKKIKRNNIIDVKDVKI